MTPEDRIKRITRKLYPDDPDCMINTLRAKANRARLGKELLAKIEGQRIDVQLDIVYAIWDDVFERKLPIEEVKSRNQLFTVEITD